MVVKNIAILFSGNGSNLEAILKKVHNRTFGDVKIVAKLLICNVQGAGGIERARKYGLETKVISHKDFESREGFDEALLAEIEAANVDLVVLAGFMRVLSGKFCSKVRAINLHPSLLPLFKGAHAIKESFESDMKVGGVSVHWVSAELDGGKIIAQKTFERKNRDLENWEKKIHKIEHKLLPSVIVGLLADKGEFKFESDVEKLSKKANKKGVKKAAKVAEKTAEKILNA